MFKADWHDSLLKVIYPPVRTNSGMQKPEHVRAVIEKCNRNQIKSQVYFT